MKTVIAKINLDALEHNMQKIKSKVADAQVIAVLKANAYGHGDIACSKIMDKYVSGYAVARLEEAIHLREHGCKKRILMLGGYFKAEDLKVIEELDIDFTVHNFNEIAEIKNYKATKKLNAWFQVNIGMQRLGFNENDYEEAFSQLNALDNIHKPLGMISHLSCADSETTALYNEKQIAMFQKMKQINPNGFFSLANSASILYFPLNNYDFVRSGIIQYGISPSNENTGEDLGFEPVMTLSTSIIEIRELAKGDVVGYGASWVCEKPTKIAILAIGYADGYPRAMPNGSPVLINGRIVHTVGHVCMDMMFVDIGLDAVDKIGDEAILWGKGNPVEKIASAVNTIAYELVTRPTSRVRYQYIYHNKEFEI